jgi:hypothetical protein
MDLRKIYGGTPVGQASRCDTCVYARIIRGYAQSEKITICDRIFQPVRIPFPVSECTDYLDKRLPCIEDLEQMAWELRSKSAGKRAGFTFSGTGPAAEEEDHAGSAAEAQPEEVPAASKNK